MSIICPKCSAPRPADATVPEWQCPACGVCYAKVGRADAKPARRAAAAPHPEWQADLPKMVLAVVLVVGCAWTGLRMLAPATGRGGRPPLRHNLSEDEIRALAVTTRPADIVMYSTTECVYCVQAKQWLTLYGFSFKECNMSLSRDCEREFLRYGANGTPFLVVRGHQMKDGFVTREFLADLQY